jgi:hypothetical protein
MSEAFQADKHGFPYQTGDQQKCFIAHSYEAEWHDTIEEVCKDLLPEYGLEPWYAEHNYDPTTTLRNKVVTMIDAARYGIYDLSYWRPNEHSPWVMPCNVLIELGIAIALNRPTILLRHTESRIAKIELPESIKSVTQISEFTGGDYTLEKALREHLSQLANLPQDQDWRHRRCLFGEIDCSYIHVNPHTAMIGDDKLHCHIADGPDPDQIDFRSTVERVLDHFNNISYSYLDKAVVPGGYTFLLCAHCQLIRSTPFAIYRITPYTLPDTYIAIGISIGMEYRSRYKIPRFMITKDMQYVPSLLSGYEFVLMKNLHSLKTRLPQFVQHIMIKIDEPAYWRPHELPFETRVITEATSIDKQLRSQLIDQRDLLDLLSDCVPAIFTNIVFSLKAPRGIWSSDNMPQAQRAVELIQWAEHDGPGLKALYDSYMQAEGNRKQPSPKGQEINTMASNLDQILAPFNQQLAKAVDDGMNVGKWTQEHLDAAYKEIADFQNYINRLKSLAPGSQQATEIASNISQQMSNFQQKYKTLANEATTANQAISDFANFIASG